MEKTDLLEIKKLFKYPECHFGKIGYAVISSLDHEGEEPAERINYTGESKFLTRDDEEQKLFLSLLTKAFCFQDGVSSCDVPVTGDIKMILSSYALSDNDVPFNLMPFTEELIKSYDYIKAFALVFFKGSYDIPIKDTSKTKTGESEEVYKYVAIMLCPIGASKIGLSPKDGDIKRGDVVRVLQQPLFGIIYPSFTDRASDPDHAFVCCRKEAEASLASSLFKEDVPAPVKKSKAKIIKEPGPEQSAESDKERDEEGEYVYRDASAAAYAVDDSISVSSSSGSSSLEYKEPSYDSDKMHRSSDLGTVSEVNDIDSALLRKREGSSSDDEDEFVQNIEVKEDKSSLSHDKVTERDIGGKKFFIIPKDLLPADILEKILALEGTG